MNVSALIDFTSTAILTRAGNYVNIQEAFIFGGLL